MTPEDYASGHEHETPYLYHLAGGGKDLLYFGAEHTNNPAHPALSRLAAEFSAFKPDLALIEGIPQINTLSAEQIAEYTAGFSIEALVKKIGEKGVVAKLATELGCELYSPEPSDAAAVGFLLGQGFSRDEIFIQQVADQIPQFARQDLDQDFQNYMQPYFKRMQENFEWSGYNFSVAHFELLHATLLKRSFDLHDIHFYVELSDPIPWPDRHMPYGRINMLAAAWNGYRDRYIVQNIAEQFKTHDRIFVVYGASHAVMQEPALRNLFDSF